MIMTIAITVVATLGSLFLLAGTYHAGIRKGSIATLNEVRRAVHLAGLEGTMTVSGPTIH